MRNTMSVTVTIKQVPDKLAEQLRQRAARNRRSLQRELMLVLERAGDEAVSASGIHEPTPSAYHLHSAKAERSARKTRSGKAPATRSVAGKLSLDALWQRARKLGATMPTGSAAIVRRDRDARHGR